MIYEITGGKLTAKIDSFGAELISAVYNECEYMWSGNERYWGDHAPVLFPHCGRILNSEYSYKGKKYAMGIHGFASKSEFRATRVEKSALTLTLASNDETRKMYPFDFEFSADFSVEDDTLSVKFTVKNTGDETLPYMVGWHPGFNLHGDGDIESFTLKFGGKGDSLIWHPLTEGFFVNPEGKNYPAKNCTYRLNEEEIYSNDTIIFRGTEGRAILSSPDTDKALTMSYSENLPYFCIWKETDSRARFVCLEPWSDIPHGDDPENFETKAMSRLAPDGKEDYVYTVKFS